MHSNMLTLIFGAFASLMTIITALPAVPDSLTFPEAPRFHNPLSARAELDLPAKVLNPKCTACPTEPNKCFLGTIYWWNDKFGIYSVFRNTCEVIGYNPSVRISDVEKFAMNSQLKDVIDVSVWSHGVAPGVSYRGKLYGMWDKDE